MLDAEILREYLLTAFPGSSITANTSDTEYAPGDQFTGCAKTIGSCDHGPTLCIDTSSGGEEFEETLPCIELQQAMTTSSEDMDSNGQEGVPTQMNAPTNIFIKPNTADTPRFTKDLVKHEAQPVIPQCPVDRPSKMCGRHHAQSQPAATLAPFINEVGSLVVPAGNVGFFTTSAARSAAFTVLLLLRCVL